MRSLTAFAGARSIRCIRGRHACSRNKSYILPSYSTVSKVFASGRFCTSYLVVHQNIESCAGDMLNNYIKRESDVSILTDEIIINGVPGSTYAALTRRRLVWGCPSVATKRICLGAEGLPPFFFFGEGGLIASQ